MFLGFLKVLGGSWASFYSLRPRLWPLVNPKIGSYFLVLGQLLIGPQSPVFQFGLAVLASHREIVDLLLQYLPTYLLTVVMREILVLTPTFYLA